MPLTVERPRAIAMWDFSWLERRWPGAGYEDWDLALDQLVERGYDSLRIDPYPHLIDADADRTWTLLPRWTQQTWGAPARVDVRPLPSLVGFVRRAADRGIGIALSSWFRQDPSEVRMTLATPEDLARVWVTTLDALAEADLLDSILFVDLCNELTLPLSSPFLYGTDRTTPWRADDARVREWTTEAVDRVRAAHPGLAYTVSLGGDVPTMRGADVSRFDLLEPHIWMAGASDYYDLVGYDFERFEPTGYDNLVARGRRVYEDDRARFDAALFDEIDRAAEWSRSTGLPLGTTECWSIIDYKDWPGLDWDWVMDLNERGLDRAAATGRWVALASSNFCGPQFVGAWRDIAYHRRLTDRIRSGALDPELRS